MSNKSNQKSTLQIAGIILFVFALGTFIASLSMSSYVLDEAVLKSSLNNDYHYSFVEKHLGQMQQSNGYKSSFAFMGAYNNMMKMAQEDILKDVTENKGLTQSDGEYWNQILQDYKIKEIRFPLAKSSSQGLLRDNAALLFFLSFILGIIGALLYILPKSKEHPGIKNNHIYHSALHNRGWLGIAAGIYLILFYIVLYFYPEHLVNWVIMVDPVSEFLNGGPASQWFLYGFLYTICILVMGVRMIIKYRHNKYQMIRTGSVMFFQTAFAFLIPQILTLLNQPSMDLKNMWPLDYSFFFEYNLNNLISSGGLGIFMLVWGIALFMIGVPVITYFYGKRWYCSWVCGCGGLAETLGDPFRQQSDKSMEAWQIERFLIHGVLVFAVVMTGLVLFTYFTGQGISIPINQWLFLILAWGIGAGLYFMHRRKYPYMQGRKVLTIVGIFVVAITIGVFSDFFPNYSGNVTFNSYDVRSVYGFAIGSMFAGVVGTGFYPLMGNRVWCRFGCPLAAYLGLVQKFKSRFRITVNGGQCISCGNCSTYCEMGIDVRSYAQKGQDIVRSSCVGCGVCAAVCPRGVLRLENASEDISSRTEALRTIHITEDQVTLLS
jgi:polyferredoxin